MHKFQSWASKKNWDVKPWTIWILLQVVLKFVTIPINYFEQYSDYYKKLLLFKFYQRMHDERNITEAQT